jgi:hypothetical protein
MCCSLTLRLIPTMTKPEWLNSAAWPNSYAKPPPKDERFQLGKKDCFPGQR